MVMSLSRAEVEAAIRAWPREEQIALAEMLLVDAECDIVRDPSIAQAWNEEIAWRLAEYEAGRMLAIPSEEAMQQLRQRLRNKS
jgi:hypothetical protein